MGKAECFLLLVFFFFLASTLSASAATTETNSCGIATTNPPAPSPSAGPADADPSTSFIISSCAYNTLYPRLCARTLTPYADAVGTSARRLAYAAVDAALQRASDSAALVSRLYGRERPADAGSELTGSSSPAQRSLTGPLRDCAETMSDSLDRLRMSAREMRLMGLPSDSDVGAKGGDRTGEADNEFQSHLSNVQTWLSAALTDQTTCLDGFDEGLPPASLVGSEASSGAGAGAVGMGGAGTDSVTAVVRKSVLHVSHMTSNALALINRIGTPAPH